jgi:L-threonylcarbamoyladenylate synthase
MEIIRINPAKIAANVFDQIKKVLDANGVIGHPTDTVYGLAANVNSEKAVKKIYDLKNRDNDKPLSMMVKDIAMIESITGFLSPFMTYILSKYLPGALTVIIPIHKDISFPYFKDRKTIGFRIPMHNFCLELLQHLNYPITTTSANKSGLKNPELAMEVLSHFGKELDLLIDGGKTKMSMPSTIIEFENDSIKYIREGSISFSEIQKYAENYKG